MSLEKNSDLPESLRNGLNGDQQTIVRGMYNALVYEQSMSPEQATAVVTKALQSSGMIYDGKWTIVKDDAAVGVITKVDEDKRLVFGWASIIKDEEGKVLLDRQDDFIDDESELEKSAYTYVLHSRDGGEMHLRKGVSTMVESVVLTKEKQQAIGIPVGTIPVGWWIGFRVNDDRVWEEVKKGNYAGFSVHGTGQRSQQVLNEGEYTEVEKRDFSNEQRRTMAEEGKALPDRAMTKSSVKVSKRHLELLSKARKNKIATVMREFKAGKLKSSSGEKVTDPKQAMAIAISEQKKLKKGDKPGHPFRGNQHTSGKGNRKAIPSKPPRMTSLYGGGTGGGKPKMNPLKRAYLADGRIKPKNPEYGDVTRTGKIITPKSVRPPKGKKGYRASLTEKEGKIYDKAVHETRVLYDTPDNIAHMTGAMAVARSRGTLGGKKKGGVSKHGSHDQSTHGKRGGKSGRGTVAERNKRVVNALADRQEKLVTEKKAKMSQALKDANIPNARIASRTGKDPSSGMNVAIADAYNKSRRVSVIDMGGFGYSVTSTTTGPSKRVGTFTSLDRAVEAVTAEFSTQS